jgi:hypothetical protein
MWQGGVKTRTSPTLLKSDDCAGEGIVVRNCSLEKHLQGFQARATEIGETLADRTGGHGGGLSGY